MIGFVGGGVCQSRRLSAGTRRCNVVLMSRVVVVTGASRGLGLGFVRHYTDEDTLVIGGARSKPGKDLYPEGAVFIKLDVTNKRSVRNFVREIARKTSKVDLLINNAGVLGKENHQLDNSTADDFVNVFRVNTIGPFLLVQAMSEMGLLSRGSVVANISSKVGSIEENTSGQRYAYRASKAALNVITKSMAVDLAGDGVICTLLHPGFVRTSMTGDTGLIDVDRSVRGMTSVLETMSKRELQGTWHDYKQETIPW